MVGETLTEKDAYAIGRGFGTLIARAGGSRVAVGYDGRLSSPALETALIEGLNGSGIHAVRIGRGTTPMLYYAEAVQDVDGGIQITGSHKHANYNGFKMVLQQAPFFGAAIQKLGRMGGEGDWDGCTAGSERVDRMEGDGERGLQEYEGGGGGSGR